MAKRKQKIQCSTPHCEDLVNNHPKLLVCDACYWNLWSWMKRGPAAVLRRKKQLRKFYARMNEIAPTREQLDRRPPARVNGHEHRAEARSYN